MEMNLYAVLDRVSNVCMVPFPATNHGAAIRSFGDGMKDPQGPFHKHPQDYALLHIGKFNDNTGVVSGVEGGLPQTISSGSDWITAPSIAGAVQTKPETRTYPVPQKH